MKPTRQHIADKALQLFNHKGFVNVRLQHIADAAFVSIGHLAYHFKNKDSLVEFLFEQMMEDKWKVLKEHKHISLFQHLNLLFIRWYEHQQKYRFLYVDVVELARAYPPLGARLMTFNQTILLQLLLMLEFNQSRGVFNFGKKSKEAVAIAMQNYMDHWLHNHTLCAPEAQQSSSFSEGCWFFLSSYFTYAGWQEYEGLL